MKVSENIKCVITDMKDNEDFSIPKVFIEEWVKENLEDIIYGRYRFNGIYEIAREVQNDNNRR